MAQTRDYFVRATVLLLFLCSFALAKLQLPSPQGIVNDFTNKLSLTTEQRLEKTIRDFRDRSGIDVAVVMIPASRLQGYSIETYALELGREWKVGRGSQKLGLLLLVAIKPPDSKGVYQGQTRLEVSRHLEADLPDGMAGEITRGMRGDLKAGRFDQALSLGVDAIIAELSRKRNIPNQSRASSHKVPPPKITRPVSAAPSDFFFVIFVLTIIFVLLFFVSRFIIRRDERRGDSPNRWSGNTAGYENNYNRVDHNWADNAQAGHQPDSSSFGVFSGGSPGNDSGSSSSDYSGGSSSGGDSSNDSVGGGGDFGGGGASDSW